MFTVAANVWVSDHQHMRFTFVHAADIHLDRSLNGLRSSESLAYLQLAPRQAFVNLVDEAIRLGAAFVLLPGDIYDGAWKDSSTGLFFNAQMGRLREAGIPVFLLYGNHDAIAAMPKTLHLPDNVRVFGTTAAHTFRIDDLAVVLHGQSFAIADTRNNLAAGYPEPVHGCFNIGLLHTAIEGADGHDPYAPCTLEQLRAKGYDYWALGHVHTHRVLSEDPWVVFPGNLQGLHVNEAGARGAVQVTVDDGRVIQVERLLVDVLRWASLRVDVSGVSEREEIWVRVGNALRQAMAGLDGRHLCARVTLSGASPFHSWLRVHPLQVEDEVLAQAAALGEDVSIERVRVDTSDPRGESPVDHGDALGDLQGFLEEAAHDPEFLASLRDALMPVVLELPELDRDTHPEVALARSGEFEALATAKKAELLYRIQEG